MARPRVLEHHKAYQYTDKFGKIVKVKAHEERLMCWGDIIIKQMAKTEGCSIAELRRYLILTGISDVLYSGEIETGLSDDGINDLREQVTASLNSFRQMVRGEIEVEWKSKKEAKIK